MKSFGDYLKEGKYSFDPKAEADKMRERLKKAIHVPGIVSGISNDPTRQNVPNITAILKQAGFKGLTTDKIPDIDGIGIFWTSNHTEKQAVKAIKKAKKEHPDVLDFGRWPR